MQTKISKFCISWDRRGQKSGSPSAGTIVMTVRLCQSIWQNPGQFPDIQYPIALPWVRSWSEARWHWDHQAAKRAFHQYATEVRVDQLDSHNIVVRSYACKVLQYQMIHAWAKPPNSCTHDKPIYKNTIM